MQNTFRRRLGLAERTWFLLALIFSALIGNFFARGQVALLLYLLGQPTFAIVAAAVAVVYLAMDLGMYPMRMGKLKKEREASEKRLSDPDYARALKRAGIDVPERYLKGESKGKDEEK